MIEILINIGAGSLGALAYLWHHSLSVITASEWSWSIHWKENYKRWIWIWFGLIILSLIAKVTPEAFKLILKHQSFEIPDLAIKGTFLVIGYFVAKTAKNKVNKVI